MWFLIPIAIAAGKVAYDIFTSDDSSNSSSSTEQQKREQYQQQQKETRAAEMRKNICAYATSGASGLITRHASLSLQGTKITMGDIATFVQADTVTPESAMSALSSLTGSRMRLNRRREAQQIQALESELAQLAHLIESLESEKEKNNGRA
ncbi:hypothetical protein [Erwinia sp. CGal63]|uniref:hypothetical protein n=1 Tax=Erwinia sp. CGal63 TaxID=2919889 RepID=UPI00300BE486